MQIENCKTCHIPILFDNKKKYIAFLKHKDECNNCYKLKFKKSKISLLTTTHIKALIFDLDGVLIHTTKDIHYKILNKAIRDIAPNYMISYEEHIKIFDGLTTKNKLKILVERGMNTAISEKIYKLKQDYTFSFLKNIQTPNYKELFLRLKKEGFKIGVCTNSTKETTQILLSKMEIYNICDIILDNSCVEYNKPDPSIYLLAQQKLNLNPSEIIVFEDSKHGITASELSKCNTFYVENTNQINFKNILSVVKSFTLLEQIIKLRPQLKQSINFSIKKDFVHNRYICKTACLNCHLIRWTSRNDLKKWKFTNKCNKCWSSTKI